VSYYFQSPKEKIIDYSIIKYNKKIVLHIYKLKLYENHMNVIHVQMTNEQYLMQMFPLLSIKTKWNTQILQLYCKCFN